MKLGTFVFLGTTGVLSVCLAGMSTEGCSSGGSSSNGSSSGGASTTGGCDDGGACILPPPVPDAGATTSTTPQNFALHHLHVGEELNDAGVADWASYGFNIDGKNTTQYSTDVCTLSANASKKNQIDGNGGIDNSFAENIIIGLLSAVLQDPSATIDTSLAKGSFTVLLDVTGMSGTPGQSATGLSGLILEGVPFFQAPNSTTAAPTFTLADTWPVNADSLTNPPVAPSTTIPTPITSKITFSGAYMNNGVFVSGAPTDVSLTLSIDSVPLVIPIQHATITFNNPGADGGAHNISGGIIGGVIDANQLVANLQGVAGNIEQALCKGSTFQQLAEQILAAADIMDDGTNNAGTPCNGISIGVGFDADEIAQPTVTGTPATGTNPCDDAGAVDSGSGAVDSGTGTVDSGAAQDATGD